MCFSAFVLFAAPTSYPENFDAAADEQYTIKLTWSEVRYDHQNGQILGYIIRKHGSEPRPIEYNIIGEQTSFELYDNRPDRRHLFSIAAYNEAGNGVFSPVIAVVFVTPDME